MSDKDPKPNGGCLGGAIVVLLLVFAPFITIPKLYQAYTSAGWPTTNGRITESKVGWTMGGSRGQNRPIPYHHLRYGYEVDGQPYRGIRRQFFSEVGLLNSGVDKHVARYRPGSEVTVYYSPEHPSKSVLIPGIYTTSPSGWTVPSIYILFAALSSAFVLFVIIRIPISWAHERISENSRRRDSASNV